MPVCAALESERASERRNRQQAPGTSMSVCLALARQQPRRGGGRVIFRPEAYLPVVAPRTDDLPVSAVGGGLIALDCVLRKGTQYN